MTNTLIRVGHWSLPFKEFPETKLFKFFEDEKNSRLVLKLKPHLSPIKAAVIPLKRNNDELVNKAKLLKKELQKIGLGRVMLENSGNIGKNYRRHDEIGTPLCVTVDIETLENESVTIRDRDSMD